LWAFSFSFERNFFFFSSQKIFQKFSFPLSVDVVVDIYLLYILYTFLFFVAFLRSLSEETPHNCTFIAIIVQLYPISSEVIAINEQE